MISGQTVERSVISMSNSPSQSYPYPGERTLASYNLSPQLKPFPNYLLTSSVWSLRENLKIRPCRIGQVIAKLIQQGQGLRFSHKDQTFEVNLLFILWF